MRKLRDELGGKSLSLEGPYADRGEAIAQIVDGVKTRVKLSPHDKVMATLLTICPQNTPVKTESSWLREAFIFHRLRHEESTARDSAGVVASLPTIEHGGDQVRVADFEELTMIGVAVLRRLGIPSHYGILHFEPHYVNAIAQLYALLRLPLPEGAILESRPCIVLSDEKHRIAKVVPPSVIDEPIGGQVTALEVLDGDALTSILRMRHALGCTNQLILDVAKRGPEFLGEGPLRARYVGHTLFEAMNRWTHADANADLLMALQMMGRGRGEVKSIRTEAESEYAHPVACPACHIRRAASAILCEAAKIELDAVEPMEGAHEMTQQVVVDLVKKLVEIVKDHTCIGRLSVYTSLMGTIIGHIHPPSECEDAKSAGMGN